MYLSIYGEAGVPLGPFPPWEAHPATVHFPIAFLLGAVVLDLYAWQRARADLARVATGLMAAGVIQGLVAVATGLLAFFTIQAHTAIAHDQMYWHLGLIAAALALFSVVYFARRRRRDGPGIGARTAGLVATGLLAVGGFLGGQIVYRGGAGVDPAILIPEIGGNASQVPPQPGGKPGGGENPAPKKPHEH